MAEKDRTFDATTYCDALDVEYSMVSSQARPSEDGKATKARRLEEIAAELKKYGRTPPKAS